MKKRLFYFVTVGAPSLKRFSIRVVTESLRTPRALFQEECLCNAQLILILSQYLPLQKYRLQLFTFCRTDGRRSINVHLFYYVQMFCSGQVRSFHSSPCQRLYRHFFQDSLMNRKLKRAALIINQHIYWIMWIIYDSSVKAVENSDLNHWNKLH